MFLKCIFNHPVGHPIQQIQQQKYINNSRIIAIYTTNTYLKLIFLNFQDKTKIKNDIGVTFTEQLRNEKIKDKQQKFSVNDQLINHRRIVWKRK